jgi:hypothetical protein
MSLPHRQIVARISEELGIYVITLYKLSGDNLVAEAPINLIDTGQQMEEDLVVAGGGGGGIQ